MSLTGIHVSSSDTNQSMCSRPWNSQKISDSAADCARAQHALSCSRNAAPPSRKPAQVLTSCQAKEQSHKHFGFICYLSFIHKLMQLRQFKSWQQERIETLHFFFGADHALPLFRIVLYIFWMHVYALFTSFSLTVVCTPLCCHWYFYHEKVICC